MPRFASCAAPRSAPTRKPDGALDRETIVAHVGRLVDESIDCVAVSTAHGHSAGVGDMVKIIRQAFPALTLVAGNVTSADGVEFLAKCGANAIKIGRVPAPSAPRASWRAWVFRS